MSDLINLQPPKSWNEGASVGLAAVVSNEDDLGPELALQHNPLALVSGGDHPLAAATHRLGPGTSRFFGCVFAPARSHGPRATPQKRSLGEVARSRPYRLPEHKKNVVREELKAILDLGVIEESHSD